MEKELTINDLVESLKNALEEEKKDEIDLSFKEIEKQLEDAGYGKEKDLSLKEIDKLILQSEKPRSNSQIAKITEILTDKELMTEKQIAENTGSTIGRVRRAFKKLIYRKEIMVKIDKKGLVFLESRYPEKKGKQVFTITDPKNSVYVKKYLKGE